MKTVLLTLAVLGWGLPRGSQNPGEKFQKIIDNHDAYYIGDKEKNEIYLTFDVGYELGNTTIILDVLKEENIKAAFFVTGHFLNTNPDLVKRMNDEGHIVGNHTYHHYDLSTLSFAEYKEELESVENKYREITNCEIARFLRPPRGIISDSVLSVSDKLDYTCIYWSLAYVDWKTNESKGEDYAYNSIINNIGNGDIILLHTVSNDNTKALKRIISSLKENYTFKSLDNLILEN